MYSKRFKKLVSIIMIVTMVMANVNLNFSTLFENNKKENVEVQAKETKKKEPTVVKELEHLRTADSSTYLLSNGTKRLELYGEDIRYEKNGKFIDYDPTLKKLSNTNKKELGKSIKGSKILKDNQVKDYAYTNTSSDTSLYFPEVFDENTGIVLENNNKVINFKPSNQDTVVDQKEVLEEENPTTEVIEEETSLEGSLETNKILETEKLIVEETTKTEEASIKIKEKSINDNLISYIDEANNIEYKYTSLPTGLKEEIILKERPDTNIFSFDINLDGMKLEILEGTKEVRIYDKKTNHLVAYISEPNIKHADSDKTYEEVYYELEDKKDGSYVLKVVVSEDYLLDESTKYPVIIDPTITWTSDNLESAAVSSFPYTTTVNMKNTITMQLKNKCNTQYPYTGTVQYCYIDTTALNSSEVFGELTNLSDVEIQSANLRLVEYETNGQNFYNHSTGTTTLFEFQAGNVEVKSITGTWDPDTITWDNKAGIGTDVWATFACTGTSYDIHDVNLTNWAKSVFDGDIDNYGLVLQAKEEGTGDTFYSSQPNSVTDSNGNVINTQMVLTLEYSDNGRYYGIEGVYSPTGNYAVTSDDMNVQTVLGNISISRTYNSLKYDNQSVIGNGFTLNYAMRVITTQNGAKVLMPNGSIWSFNLSGTNYVAMGNNGTLALDSDNRFVLTTLDKTEYGFDTSGYLIYVKDDLENQINITLDNNKKITSITDNNGVRIDFSYTDNLVTKVEHKISNSVLQTVSYFYDTSDNLTKVVYPGGREKHYEYTDNRLTKISNSGTNGSNSLKEIVLEYYTSGEYIGLVKSVENSIEVKDIYSYDRQNKATTITGKDSSGSTVRSQKETYNTELIITKVEDLLYESNDKQIEAVQYEEAEVINPDMPSSTTDQYGEVTYYEYDENGNLIKTTYPDESTEEYVYDLESNNLTSYTDRNGLVTNYTYLTEEGEDNTQIQTGFLLSVVTGNRQTNTYTYYPETTYGIEGLVQSETDIHGNVTNYTYDNQGNVLTTTQVINGANYTTTNTYNDLGWLTKTIDPNGVCTEYFYNDSGNILLTKVSDINGQNVQIARTVYDTLGRVIQEISPEEYNPNNDNLETYIYSDTTAGKRTIYNSKGQVEKEIDSLGNITEFIYDADGNVINEKQPNGSYSQILYDRYGRKTNEVFYNSSSEEPRYINNFEYFENENKIKITEYVTDGLFSIRWELYDWEGNLIQTDYDNGLIEYSDYEAGLLVKTHNNQGGCTEYTYDQWGRVLSETSAFDETGDSKTTYSYDNYGNLSTEIAYMHAANQQNKIKRTMYYYDSQDNLITTTVASGDGTSIQQNYYSWDGKLLREYKGLTGVITINGLDNISNPNNFDYNVIKYEYDTMGRLSKKTDALGKVETYGYDKENRENYKKDRNGVEHHVEYDDNGNETKRTSGNIVKAYTYDNMGNVSTEKEGVKDSSVEGGVRYNTTTTYTYDKKGNCLSETTGNVVKTYTYNNMDLETSQVITVDGVVKQNIEKTYNSKGNLASVKENGSVQARYTYNLQGQLIEIENTNGITEKRTYNKAGFITSVTNVEDTEVISKYVYTYYYDGTERSKSDMNGTTTYIYDGVGQLVREVKDDYIDNNTSKYNAEELKIDVPKIVNISAVGQTRYYSFTPSTSCSYTIESGYNNGDPDVKLYSEDETLIAEDDNGKDEANFKIQSNLTSGNKYIIAVKDKSGKGSCSIKITQNPSLVNTSRANAKMISEEYPIPASVGLNQLRYFSFIPSTTGVYTIKSTNFSAVPLATIYLPDGTTLTSDINGNNGLRNNLKYQLTAGVVYTIGVRASGGSAGCVMTIFPPENAGNTTSEYIYDANGNRIELREKGTDETVYTYDDNDRLLSEQKGEQAAITYSYDDNGNMLSKSDGTVQTYDSLNRMTSYKSSDGITTSYTYYPDDMRKSKKTGTADTITQIWSNGNIVLDLNGTTIVDSYVFGEKLVKSSENWYLYNAHGDVVALTDNYGIVTKNYEYDPFGVQTSDEDETDLNPYRYCGEYYDVESGYTYLEARYYDPKIGRFVSEDPAFDGNNWYVYCGNDPINKIDSTGMWSGKIHKEVTESAFDNIKLSKKMRNKLKRNIALKFLLSGCVYPDKARSDNEAYKDGKWHGHNFRQTIMTKQIEKAKKMWKNKQYKKAYWEIGKALHTIQDFYAHNVVLDGVVTNSRKVANGWFYEKNGIVNVTKHEDYFTRKFINKCINVKNFTLGVSKEEKGENATSVHSLTADNPYAYFDDRTNKWKWGSKKSQRYYTSIDSTEKYLRIAVNEINKTFNKK